MYTQLIKEEVNGLTLKELLDKLNAKGVTNYENVHLTVAATYDCGYGCAGGKPTMVDVTLYNDSNYVVVELANEDD